jgi:hypothetical protein
VGDPHHHDAPERRVGLAVTSVVESEVTDDLSRVRPFRCDPAQPRPGGLGAESLGVVASCDEERVRRVGAESEECHSSGAAAATSAAICSSSAASSTSGNWMRWASEDSDDLVAAVTVSGERAGRSAAHSLMRAGTLRPVNRLWGADDEVLHLDDGLDPRLARRDFGDDERSDGLGGPVTGLRVALRVPRQRRSSGLDRVQGVGLARVPSGLSVRSVDLDDVDSLASQEACEPRAIRPRARARRAVARLLQEVRLEVIRCNAFAPTPWAH